MAAEAGYDNPDDWELINDDGFVYKRKKRPPEEPAAAAPPPPDPAVERKHRRERRKRALLKLRERYLEEISRWELLSNTLTAMEQSARTQSTDPTTSFDGASSSGEPSSAAAADSSGRRLVDELLAQVEAQEAIIRNISNLCDLAEGICTAQEDRMKQKLMDLPVWDPSPHELMAALCDQ